MPMHFGPAKLFMTVTRATSSCGGAPPFPTFTVQWTTNLSILYSLPDSSPLRLLADETTSGPSTDDIYVNITIDGVKTLRPKFPDVNRGDPLPLGDRVGVIRFVDRLDVQLEEEDNLSDNEKSESFTLAAELGPSFPAPVDGLTEAQTDTFPARPTYQFINFDDGQYTFSYNLTRQLRKKTAGLAKAAASAPTAPVPVTAPSAALAQREESAHGAIAYVAFARTPSNVFERDDGEIGAIGEDVSESNLTNDPGLDFDPAYSPDGTEMAFASNRTGQSDLYVMAARGGPPRRLTRTAATETQPAWSPDGSEIAFTRDGGHGRVAVYVIGRHGGRARRVTRFRWPAGEPAWAPTGNRLAFTRRVGRSSTAVFRLELRTGRATRLTRGRVPAHEPAWSPDGRSIAYTRGRLDGNADIWVVRARGGKERRLTRAAGPDRQAAWSPAGDRIAFTHARNEGPTELYVMPAAGGRTQRLGPSNAGVERMAPTWRP
jgi:hypothetical protein